MRTQTKKKRCGLEPCLEAQDVLRTLDAIRQRPADLVGYLECTSRDSLYGWLRGVHDASHGRVMDIRRAAERLRMAVADGAKQSRKAGRL
jgi:hypothetical protein